MKINNLIIVLGIVLLLGFAVLFYSRPYYKSIEVYDDYETFEDARAGAEQQLRDLFAENIPVGIIARRGTGSNDWWGNDFGRFGVFVYDFLPFEDLKVGMLVGYTKLYEKDGLIREAVIIHRVVMVTEEGVITRGDANNKVDEVVTPLNYEFRVISLHKPKD